MRWKKSRIPKSRSEEHTSELQSPTINSYKRLIPGYEAPCYACWSDANRSSLIRIPAVRGKGTRTELRNVDPFANPYLALAAILASGLDGIKNVKEDELIGPVYDNIFELSEEEIADRGIKRLPETLFEAINEFKGSSLMKEVLGQHTFSRYVAAKEMEWKSYHNSISAWENKHYFGR